MLESDERIDKIVAQMLCFIESQGYALVAIHPINLRNVDVEQVNNAMENAGTYDIVIQERIKNGTKES